MNITEFMSFDLSWFTTLPGILITVGVIVLLIALILFLVSNKKDKNKMENAVPVENTSAAPSIEDNNMMNNAMPNNDNMVMAGMAVDQNMNVNNPLPENNMNNVNNNNSVMNNEVVQPVDITMGTTTPSPVMDNSSNVVVPSVNENNYGAAPVLTNVVDFSNQATVNPVAEVGVAPVSNEQQDNGVYSAHSQNIINAEPTNVPVGSVPPVVAPVSAPVVPTAQEEVKPVEVASVQTPEVKPTIYGGINPINTISNTTEAKPVIYGGANPLENTTTLPVMNHEAYNISSNNVAPAPQTTPTVAPIEQTPVVEQPVIGATFTPVVEPAVSIAENSSPMFVQTDSNVSIDNTDNSSDSSSEIETLDF